MDNRQYQMPHIYVRYQDDEVIVVLPDGKILDGAIPVAKMKLPQTWIELHRDKLMADWALAGDGETPYKIEPQG